MSFALWSATETLFMTVRLNKSLTRDQIDAIASQILDNLREKNEILLTVRQHDNPNPAYDFINDPNKALEFHKMVVAGLREDLAKNDVARARPHIENLPEDLSVELEPGSYDERLVGRAVLRSMIAAEEELCATIQTEILDSVQNSPVPTSEVSAYAKATNHAAASSTAAQPAEPTKFAGPLTSAAPSPLADGVPKRRNAALKLSDLWPLYALDMKAAKRWQSESDNAASRKLFVAICGDKPLGEYGPADGALFRRTILALPASYDKQHPWRKIYFDEGPLAVVEAVKKSKEQVKTVTPKTFNKHYSALDPLWDFGRQNEAIGPGTVSIFKGLFIQIPKSKNAKHVEREKRPAWTEEHLKSLLSSSVLTGLKSRRDWRFRGTRVIRDERYWGILIGAHLGMRREEILQMRVEHCRQCLESGIWHFDLFSEGLRLKDSGSPRYVPVHDNLLELGFLEACVHGRSPKELLLKEAQRAANGKLGELFGKWFGRFRKDVCGVSDDEDFHALRHTIATRLYRAGVSVPYTEELIGHEEEERRSVFDIYNKGQTIELLKKQVVDKIVLPIDVIALKAAFARSEQEMRAKNIGKET